MSVFLAFFQHVKIYQALQMVELRQLLPLEEAQLSILVILGFIWWARTQECALKMHHGLEWSLLVEVTFVLDGCWLNFDVFQDKCLWSIAC